MAKEVKSKQKKMNARVDFTPMVDMIMLLVTFFMLCTTLQKPQSMDIAMPSDKKDINEEDRSQIAASKAVTIMIDEGRKLYYFQGKPTDDNLKETTYGKEGIRKVLLETNIEAQKKVEALKKKYASKNSNSPQEAEKIKEAYKAELEAVRNGDDTPSVIIKPSDKATYKDLMDILDEVGFSIVQTFNATH